MTSHMPLSRASISGMYSFRTPITFQSLNCLKKIPCDVIKEEEEKRKVERKPLQKEIKE